MTNRVPSADDVYGEPNRAVVPRRSQEIVEVEKVVEVVVPVMTDDNGVTWAGNIGISSSGLIFGDSTTEQEWASFFEFISKVESSRNLIVGDWVAFGNASFKYSLDDIARFCGYKSGEVIEVYASVCLNVPQLMRFNSTTFEHMRKVVKLPNARKEFWLRAAHANGWSAARLEKELVLAGEVNPVIRQKNAPKTRAIVNKDRLDWAIKAKPAQRLKLIEELRAALLQLESIDG